MSAASVTSNLFLKIISHIFSELVRQVGMGGIIVILISHVL